MREETVARRYAVAFFQQARGKGKLTEVASDLKGIAETLVAVKPLANLIAHPLVTEARKREALVKAFDGKADPLTMAFLNLLVDKQRIDLLKEIQEEFGRLVRAEKGIVLATASSAVPLTAAQKRALEKALEKKTGKDIELTAQVDPALMGGVLVRIGDTVLDGTVRGQLERLREQFLAHK